jgi:ABC-type transporter Mla MlaB component
MEQLTFEVTELAPNRLQLKAMGSFGGGTLKQLEDFARETSAKIADMHERSGDQIACVFDLLGVSEAKDPAAINALVEFQKHNKPHVRRTALVVKDPQVRFAMSVIGALADRYNIRSFATYQEAEAWAFSEAE